MNRRGFFTTVAAAAATKPGAAPGPLCFFSKHLPNMTPRAMARALRAAGYGGIELTVRPGGHVLPDKVATDLPRAIEDIRAEGLEVPIIATALTAAGDRTTRPVLATAAKLGVRYFRPGWFNYESPDVHQDLARAGRALAGLTAEAKRAGVTLAYQNHVGNLGAATWDLMRVIEPLDRKWAGVYFDILHAVAEGGAGSWKVALRLALPRLKVFSVKDFSWQPVPGGGGWKIQYCPLGQGMCQLRPPLEILLRQGFRGPITVFLEYAPKGGTGEDAVLAAAAEDLRHLKAKIAEAT